MAIGCSSSGALAMPVGCRRCFSLQASGVFILMNFVVSLASPPETFLQARGSSVNDCTCRLLKGRPSSHAKHRCSMVTSMSIHRISISIATSRW